MDRLPQEIIDGHLEELRERYERGESDALIKAMRFCGREKAVMPEWVVDAFHKATNAWINYEVRTLDEAFNVELPKGFHLKAARKRRRLRPQVGKRVTEEINKGRPRDEDLFEEIGEEFSIGKTLASQLFYEWEHRWVRLFRKK